MVRHSRAFMAQLFGYCLTHLNADGGYGTVDFSDGELILDTARRVAAEQAIPLILCGYSRYQVENGLKLDGFESPRDRELQDRTETAGIPLTDIATGSALRTWWRASDFPAERVARMVFPMAARGPAEDEVRAAGRGRGRPCAPWPGPAGGGTRAVRSGWWGGGWARGGRAGPGTPSGRPT